MLAPATRRPVPVPSGSDARDEHDGSFLGIAEESALARDRPMHQGASVALTVIHAAEGEARHIGRCTMPRACGGGGRTDRDAVGTQQTRLTHNREEGTDEVDLKLRLDRARAAGEGALDRRS